MNCLNRLQSRFVASATFLLLPAMHGCMEYTEYDAAIETNNNTSNWNTTNWNTSNWNTTNWNTTNWNTTNWNGVDWNTVNWNTTNWNTINWNTTNWNINSWNTTNWNTVNWNTTNWNTTNWNTVNWNSGDIPVHPDAMPLAVWLEGTDNGDPVGAFVVSPALREWIEDSPNDDVRNDRLVMLRKMVVWGAPKGAPVVYDDDNKWFGHYGLAPCFFGTGPVVEFQAKFLTAAILANINTEPVQLSFRNDNAATLITDGAEYSE